MCSTLIVIGSFISVRLRWRQSIRNRDFIRSVKHLFRFCVCDFIALKKLTMFYLKPQNYYDILTFDL